MPKSLFYEYIWTLVFLFYNIVYIYNNIIKLKVFWYSFSHCFFFSVSSLYLKYICCWLVASNCSKTQIVCININICIVFFICIFHIYCIQFFVILPCLRHFCSNINHYVIYILFYFILLYMYTYCCVYEKKMCGIKKSNFFLFF